MMEWVLKGIANVDVYVDDVIVGPKGDSMDELLANHKCDLKVVMERLKEHDLHVDPSKSRLFMEETSSVGI